MCRVMIVEDDSVWMEVMRNIVQRFSDVELTSSHISGDTAYNELSADVDESVDMIISDLVLTTSRVQGNDLFEFAKKHGIQFVAVTSEPFLAPLDCRVIRKDHMISFLNRFDVASSPPGSPQRYSRTTLNQFLLAVAVE